MLEVRGWGYVIRECPTQKKHKLQGAQWGRLFASERDARPCVDLLNQTIRSNASLLENDRYLNPDPLARLIGAANETTVPIKKQNSQAIVGSGSMVSQITLALAKALQLKIHRLSTILSMEGAAGVKVPYICCAEALLNIPDVRFLVV